MIRLAFGKDVDVLSFGDLLDVEDEGERGIKGNVCVSDWVVAAPSLGDTVEVGVWGLLGLLVWAALNNWYPK